jgi:8-oxo-dGTP diphosphatase
VNCIVLVVAALIQADKKLLVCQRKRGTTLELKWEFPGGKVRPGESLAAALARELHEELNVSARIGAELYRTRHRYTEMPESVEVVFFAAEVDPQKICNCVFERVEWCEPESLGELDFLEADRDLINLLAGGKLLL